MARLIRTIAVTVMVLGSSHGQTVSKLSAKTDDGNEKHGSACCISRDSQNRAFWLTCWHVVDGGGNWEILGKPASLYRHDGDKDLAVMVTDADETISAFRLAHSVRVGTTIEMQGYGMKGILRSTRASIGHRWIGRPMMTEYLVLDTEPEPGDSGGAVVAVDGKTLVGIIQAKADGIGLAIAGNDVRTFLLASGFTCMDPKVSETPEQNLEQREPRPGCGNGACPIMR